MKKRDKRAQAKIISTVLIILIVLLAIIIIWGVVRMVVETGSEKISIQQFAYKADLEYSLSPDGKSSTVKVERSSGGEEIAGVKIIFKDVDGRTYHYNNKTDFPGELETEIYVIKASDLLLNDFLNIKTLSVYFFYEQNSKEKITHELDSEKRVSKITTPECVYEDWISQGCGLGGCSSGKLYLTRGVVNGTDCTETEECITHEDCEIIAEAISYWKFDDNLNDSNGNNDGTFYGGTENYVSGRNGIGTALNFDGIGNYVDTGNDVSLNLEDSNFTISAWVNIVGWIVGGDTIFYEAGSNSGLYFYQSIDFQINEGNITLWFYGDDYHSPQTISLNNWHHVAVTYGMDTKEGIFYINGSQVDSHTYFIGPEFTVGTMVGSQLGARYLGTARTIDFNGTMDDVMIYDRALNETEIKDIYCVQGGEVGC